MKIIEWKIALKFFGLLNRLNVRKSIFYMRDYGLRAFYKKAKEKFKEGQKFAFYASRSRNHPAINFIRQRIAPLNLHLTYTEKMRVNILISIIDFKYFFAGYIGVFNLAKSLTKVGCTVRIIIVDECKYEPDVWRHEIRKYEGLEHFFDYVEVVYAFSRSETIPVSRQDVFFATSWWTAHIANYARRYLNSKRFLYLIQDYEPIFYPMGTFAALALESYNFPHYALLSTNTLREYFMQNRIGVFKEGQKTGEKSCVAIENAILNFAVDRSRMINKEKKKLLFYARPEKHAARNMFEFGMIAISDVLTGGYFASNSWEFYGIGSVDWGNHKITLADKTSLKLLPKMSLEEYKKLLLESDIGISLMMSPHPSIVPLEMAAAGMLVVTNTYANKTAEALRGISANIIPATPTIGGIEEALKTAVKNVGDYAHRMKGASIHWSQNWEDTYNEALLAKIKGFIEEIRLS